MKIKANHCPKCGKDDLNYYSHEFEEYCLTYEYKCEDCGFEGKEEYSCKFVGHYVDGILYFEGEKIKK